MDLLEFVPELIDLIVSFLPFRDQKQLNRVSKYFNVEPNKERFVEYVKKRLVKNKQYFINKLAMQIENPQWIAKYGLYPLPIGELSHRPRKTLVMDAFKNSDFPTIRAMIILYGPNNISIKANEHDYLFIADIKKITNIYSDCKLTFYLPWLYARKFGCNMAVCKQIYEFIDNMVTNNKYGLAKQFFTCFTTKTCKYYNSPDVYTILHSEMDDYLKKIYQKLYSGSYYSNFNCYKVGKLVY